MSTTSNTKRILLAAVLILLLANAVLVYLFMNRGHEPKRGRSGREAAMTAFLKEQVGFDAQQMQQYDSLSKQHHEKVKAAFEEMRNNKSQLLKELGAAGFTDSAINLAAGISAGKQKEMELNMLQHFAAIRKICKPGQLPKFDSLFYQVLAKKEEGRKGP